MSHAARKDTRYRTNLKANFRPVGRFTWIATKILNLSKGGVMLESPKHELPKGLEIEIEFTTVDRDGKTNRRRLRGKIAWKKGYRYGVEFTAQAQKAKSGK